MIRNLSYNTPELKEEIDNMVGTSYSWLQRIKMKGNGSRRYQVLKASANIMSLFLRDGSTNFCNIELRKEGIIMRFRSRQETFGWIVPYRMLSIFKSDNSFSIYAGSDFVRLSGAHNTKVAWSFLNKMLYIKAEHLSA